MTKNQQNAPNKRRTGRLPVRVTAIFHIRRFLRGNMPFLSKIPPTPLSQAGLPQAKKQAF